MFLYKLMRNLEMGSKIVPMGDTIDRISFVPAMINAFPEADELKIEWTQNNNIKRMELHLKNSLYDTDTFVFINKKDEDFNLWCYGNSQYTVEEELKTEDIKYLIKLIHKNFPNILIKHISPYYYY